MNEAVKGDFFSPVADEAKEKRYADWKGMNRLFCRAEATSRLQGRYCLRSCRVALDPGCHAGLSIL